MRYGSVGYGTRRRSGEAILLLTISAAFLTTGGCSVIDAAKDGDLLQAKLIVDAFPDRMFDTDENRVTPAEMAVLNGHNDVATYLVEKGYPLGVTKRTPYPLIMACLSRHTPESEAMLLYLLKKGANPNERDLKGGCLPLPLAVRSGMKSKVRLLVQYGADIDLPDGLGRAAMDVARDRLAFYRNPDNDLPHGELSDPNVRAACVRKAEGMVALLRSLRQSATRPRSGDSTPHQ